MGAKGRPLSPSFAAPVCVRYARNRLASATILRIRTALSRISFTRRTSYRRPPPVIHLLVATHSPAISPTRLIPHSSAPAHSRTWATPMRNVVNRCRSIASKRLASRSHHEASMPGALRRAPPSSLEPCHHLMVSAARVRHRHANANRRHSAYAAVPADRICVRVAAMRLATRICSDSP